MICDGKVVQSGTVFVVFDVCLRFTLQQTIMCVHLQFEQLSIITVIVQLSRHNQSILGWLTRLKLSSTAVLL